MSQEFWEEVYEADVETMPWFTQELDHDLARELQSRGITSGRFLDLGTGPGTQAAALARLGFEVTAIDVSQHAIEKARERFLDLEIEFRQDDILQSTLEGPFDYILDRGCFHVLPPEKRQLYAELIKSILRGTLFLKTFSILEPGTEGPYRMKKQEIERVFADLKVESVTDTEFHGTMDHPPKALFAVIHNL